MGTLTINGRKVTVDSSFAQLSPADQEKTVNEIAAQMTQQGGGQSDQPPGPPGSREYADWAAAQARAGKKLPQVSPVPPPSRGTGPMDQISAGYTAAADAIPVVGPLALRGAEALRARVQGMSPEDVSRETQIDQAANPNAAATGTVVGTVAPYLLGGTTTLGAKLLGMAPEAGLLANSLWSAGSGAVISAADTLMRGGNAGDAAKDAGIGGAIGGAIPGVGALLKSGARLIPKALDWSLGGVPSVAKTAVNTDRAAQKSIGRAMQADQAAGQGMTPALETSAGNAGQDIINLDRGGPATRRLARVSSAASPEAKAALEGAADRATPGLDTGAFLTKLAGGSADDLALRTQLEDAGRIVNGKAYRAAYSSPEAQQVFSPELQQLLQSDAVQRAIGDVVKRGSDRAAVDGTLRIHNPFHLSANDGKYRLLQKADGTLVAPNLAFWDQVKRNVDSGISTAIRGGDNTRAGELQAIKAKLVAALDAQVPSFKSARAGAAAFFGADNALDAGRQFALQPRNLPEAQAALAKMSAPDRKAFAIGAASSAIDKLKTGNTYAVVKGTFGTPAQKEFWQSVLGKQKAEQLEAFVKVQGIMDESRRAVSGGSHTYDLMVAGGLGTAGAAGSYFAPGNNFSTAAYFVAALRAGRGILGRKVDQAVAEKVANLLASNDKAALNKVITNASMSPNWQAALDAIMTGTQALARGGAMAGERQLAAVP